MRGRIELRQLGSCTLSSCEKHDFNQCTYKENVNLALQTFSIFIIPDLYHSRQIQPTLELNMISLKINEQFAN